MADMKTLLIGRMANGPETLTELRIAKQNGKDIALARGTVKQKIDQYHPTSMRLLVSEIEDLGGFAKRFRLQRQDGALPVFEAGQYVNLFVEIEGVRTSRPYSISSSPKQRSYIEIIVARTASGFVSDYFLDQVEVGMVFEANGPAGVFRYNPVFHSKRSVFLAGGSGITPFLSMSREILESGLEREVQLLYGCRNEKLAIQHEELLELARRYPNFHYHLVLSDAPAECSFRTGFIDRACISALVNEPLNASYYICGPQIMNDFCSAELAQLGVRPRQIRREMFGARQDIQNEAAWPSDLSGEEVFTIKIGERQIPAKAAESLLTALERSGVRVNVCCRSGECSLCRVKLQSGKVFMARGALLRHADEKYGYVHSCKAYPITDVELVL